MQALLWCHCFVLLTYNARYLLEEEQMAISPNASDIQCMVSILILLRNRGRANGNITQLDFQHMTNCPWLALMRTFYHTTCITSPSFHSGCWDFLWWRDNEKYSSRKVVSSPPPLSTNKSTRLECGECKDCCSLQWCTSITQRSITTTMFPLYCTDSVRWRG